MSALLIVLLMCEAASAKAVTGAVYDAPFFVWNGGSRGDGLGQFDAPSGIADVGGAMAIADTHNMRVKIVTFEGHFRDFWGGDGIEPGRMRLPVGLASAGRGMVWVVDSGNHRVQKLSYLHDDVSELTGRAQLVIGKRGKGRGEFERPSGAAVDSNRNLYVADTGNKRVQKFTSAGKFVAEWTGFEEPVGVAVDAKDRVYVVDAAQDRVTRLDASGKVVARWGEHGSGRGQLDRPLGVAVDIDGFVYVADSRNHRVQKFSPDGAFVLSVGCRGTKEGQFVEPAAVAVDAERHLYVVDSGNHRVQKLGHQ